MAEEGRRADRPRAIPGTPRRGQPRRHPRTVRRRRRPGRQVAGAIRALARPVRPRPPRPRLLSQRRRETGRGAQRLPRPHRQDAHPRWRTQCRGPRNRAARVRDRDRQGQLDPRRQPRRHQDLQQDDRRRSRQARPRLRFRRVFQGAGYARADRHRRAALGDHRHRQARLDRTDRRAQGPADPALARRLRGRPAQGVRRRAVRVLRHRPGRYAGTRGPLEARRPVHVGRAR